MPLWFSKSNVMGIHPSLVGSPVWESFSPLYTPAMSLPPSNSLAVVFSSQMCLCPSNPFWCCLFSIFSCGGFVLPVFRSFSGLFTLIGMLSGCIQSELRVLLCNLPWKSVKRLTLDTKVQLGWKWKNGKKTLHENSYQMKDEGTILISDNKSFVKNCYQNNEDIIYW